MTESTHSEREKVATCAQRLRPQIERWHKTGLKETATRTILVDPMLEALGWNVRDPDEVELEYTTIDGKAVDYALKVNRRPVIFVEAKPLSDALQDVKGITQVVGYAANAGIQWCVLTNGDQWQVYKTTEECEAPDKLLFEVSLSQEDQAADQETVDQLLRLSCSAIEHGVLDRLGEQVFTDGKVRKALDSVMQDPPRYLVGLVRDRMNDRSAAPLRIRESIARVSRSLFSESAGVTSNPSNVLPTGGTPASQSKTRLQHARKVRRAVGKTYSEAHHTTGIPREVRALYEDLDRFCMSLHPTHVSKVYQAKSIAYRVGDRARDTFCSIHLRKGGLRVWLQLKYARLDTRPAFARDVSDVGHWGVGSLELAIARHEDLPEAHRLIRQSFSNMTGDGA